MLVEVVKAVILAGGKGKRLYPLTKNMPKSMVKIGGKPLLEWQILLLKKYGIKNIIFCTNYLHDVIESYFQGGKKWNVQIEYSQEKEELGTAGAVKLAEQLIGNEDFFVLFGDEMLNIDLLKIQQYHEKKNGDATILVHEAKHPLDSDLVELNHENRIVRIFRTKKIVSQAFNMSCVYMLNSNIVKKIPSGFVDFGKHIFPKLIEEKTIHAYITEEYIQDIGTMDRLKKVEEDFNKGHIFSLPNVQGDC